MIEDNSKLSIFVRDNNIEVSDMQAIAKAFGAPFEEAGEIIATHKNIEVTSADQKAEMKVAREQRLKLRTARTTVENKRKELKADYLKQGRAIDLVAKYVKEQIEPAEQYLQLQEDFVKIKEQAAAEKIKIERLEQLAPYGTDPSLYNLDLMTDEQFNELIKSLHQAKKDAEEKEALEAEQIEEDRKAEEQRQRQRDEENEKLRAEQAKNEAELQAERDKAQALEREIADREASEKAETDRKADVERRELSAPDKEKLIVFARKIRELKDQIPAVKTAVARELLDTAETAIKHACLDLAEGAETL